MGKRSQFERIDRDFYPTPQKAVLPLVPHLPSGATFYEPCAGDNRLVEHLELMGYRCAGASDIEPRHEVVDQMDFYEVKNINSDYIITNPPWNRKILHPLLEHFMVLKPTWLLFDADWVHTKQAIKYLPYLCKIVSIGRVKWIEGSKMTGKDNCAWHLFDINNTMPTEFYGQVAIK